MPSLRVALVAVVIGFTSLPALAHHPFASTFDWKQPITVSGTVTGVEWSAPHVRVYLDVFEFYGEPMSYVLELGSPAALERYGWKKASIIAGDEIRVDGWLARSGESMISVRTVTTVDGREYFGASSFYDGYGVCVSGDYCLDEEGDGVPEGGEISAAGEEYCLP